MPASPPSAPIAGLWRRDALIAAAYALVVVAFAASGIVTNGLLWWAPAGPGAVSTVVLLLACASLVARRTRPGLVLAVAAPLSASVIMADGQIAAYFLLFEALFTPVLHGSRALARLTTRLALGGAGLALLAALVTDAPGSLVLAVGVVLVLTVLTPLMWAWEVRHHHEARHAAERLVGLEQKLTASRARHAVEAERRSIAHDLHDVIAGHLSAVSLHTSLAATLEERGARERSLAAARDASHDALRDLRWMIGVLSAEDAGALPAPTLTWPTLAARLRDRDPTARIEIDPALDGEEPALEDPAVRSALLRLAAEAVTNAVRHGEAPFVLEVSVGEDAVELVMRNGRRASVPTGTGIGRGAIAHRAAAVGGVASSGPEGECWVVRAVLPVTAEVVQR